jgi:hypothetical protein
MRAALVCSTTFRPYHGDRRSHDQRIAGSHLGFQARPHRQAATRARRADRPTIFLAAMFG